MPAISTGTALAIAGIAGAGASIASGVIGSRAAGKAAGVQAEAGTRAAELQAQSAREALAFQKQVFATQREDFAPWLGAGKGALANLSYLMGIPGQQEAGTAAPAGRTAALPSGRGNLRELLDAGVRRGTDRRIIDMVQDGGGRFMPRQFSRIADGDIPFEGGGGVDKFNPVLAGGIPGRPGPTLAGGEGGTGNLNLLHHQELTEISHPALQGTSPSVCTTDITTGPGCCCVLDALALLGGRTQENVSYVPGRKLSC